MSHLTDDGECLQGLALACRRLAAVRRVGCYATTILLVLGAVRWLGIRPLVNVSLLVVLETGRGRAEARQSHIRCYTKVAAALTDSVTVTLPLRQPDSHILTV